MHFKFWHEIFRLKKLELNLKNQVYGFMHLRKRHLSIFLTKTFNLSLRIIIYFIRQKLI